MKFSPMLNFLKKAFVAVIVLGVFLAGYSYLQSTKKEVVASPPEEQIWTVEAVRAEIRDISPTEQAYGTVSSGRGAQLRFGVAGEVVSVSARLRNGIDVKQGEVLARLDSERSALKLDEVKVQMAAEHMHAGLTLWRMAQQEGALLHALAQQFDPQVGLVRDSFVGMAFILDALAQRSGGSAPIESWVARRRLTTKACMTPEALLGNSSRTT